MEHRQLGRSGLRVSVLCLGTMGFGGAGKFANVGELDVQGREPPDRSLARRRRDLCRHGGRVTHRLGRAAGARPRGPLRHRRGARRDRRGSAAQVALAWTLGRPGVSSLVVGARTEAQLSDNLKAVELRLGDAERARLDELRTLPLLYPFWHQAASASDRLGEADLALLLPYLKD